MSFNSKEYINNYQKNNYKTYLIRVKKQDTDLIMKLDNMDNRNQQIINLLKKSNGCKETLTIKEIKDKLKPILNRKNISEIYLFGSYARGEATNNSDIDIFCERGTVRGISEVSELQREIEESLGKDIDLIFKDSRLNQDLKANIERDAIKI